eukprot:1109726-Pyramimonas_sp.AAC.1
MSRAKGDANTTRETRAGLSSWFYMVALASFFLVPIPPLLERPRNVQTLLRPATGELRLQG